MIKGMLPWLCSSHLSSTRTPPLVLIVYVIVKQPAVCCLCCCHVITDLNTLQLMLRSLNSIWVCICSPPSCAFQSIFALTNHSVNWFLFFFICFWYCMVIFRKKKKKKEEAANLKSMIFIWNDTKMSSVF